MPPVTRTQTGSLRQVQKTSDDSSSSQRHGIHKRPRRRQKRADTAHEQINEPTSEPTSQPTETLDTNEPLVLPRFTIDLSLPPEQRYLEVCAVFRDEMRGLQGLFDEVVGEFMVWVPSILLRLVCWAMLWKVYSDEETAELKGISHATGIDMYLLVCFNVVLDLLMGCSSGGAAIQDGDPASGAGAKMVHFRTLDWGMPSLRRVLIHLDFILEPQGEVVASSITYAGFVGILTGVRKGLSLSLNFRGVHNDSGSLMGNMKYYGHLGMVLLGSRPSISSLLRSCLIPKEGDKNKILPSYENLTQEISYSDGPLLSTACYICFSSEHETTVIEKDLRTAKLSSSTKFIVVTNADNESGENKNEKKESTKAAAASNSKESPVTALDELIEDANERKACAERNYRKLLRRRSKPSQYGRNEIAEPNAPLPTVEDIVALVQRYPTTNECTHFAAVMDPTAGEIAWCRYWRRPIEDDSS